MINKICLNKFLYSKSMYFPRFTYFSIYFLKQFDLLCIKYNRYVIILNGLAIYCKIFIVCSLYRVLVWHFLSLYRMSLVFKWATLQRINTVNVSLLTLHINQNTIFRSLLYIFYSIYFLKDDESSCL